MTKNLQKTYNTREVAHMADIYVGYIAEFLRKGIIKGKKDEKNRWVIEESEALKLVNMCILERQKRDSKTLIEE